MRTITVVYERHHYLYRWLKPLFASKKEFRAIGYKIEYQNIIDYFPVFRGKFQKILERASIISACKSKHDIIMLAFHHSTSDFCNKMSATERANVLMQIKSKCNLLVWLDTADSTGTCMFDVMPYVDLYFKKQLLKNVNDYCRNVYGARIFCEYYHNILQVEDEAINDKFYPHTEKKYLNKLRLSWNVGLGDLFATNPFQLFFHPYRVSMPSFHSPDLERVIDIQYHGSSYSSIVGYPRFQSKVLLTAMGKETNLKISDINRRLKKSKFIKESKNSKSILSPFGWGEICGRDFEAFAYGGCMIKQSMEHCITYPIFYKPMITYVPLKWDFSDFSAILSDAASETYKIIAKNGQNLYKYYFSDAGRMDFAQHIKNELEKTLVK